MEIYEATGHLRELADACVWAPSQEALAQLSEAVRSAVEGRLVDDDSLDGSPLLEVRQSLPSSDQGLAILLSDRLAEHIDDWAQRAPTFGSGFNRDGFTRSFPEAMREAGETIRTLGLALRADFDSAPVDVPALTQRLETLLSTATGATPGEPVGLVEYGWSLELSAAVLRGLVAMVSGPATSDAASEQPRSPPRLVETFEGQLDRLQTTVSAAEEMVSLLLGHAERDDVGPDARASARRMAVVIGELAKSSPPPVRSLNAAMQDAGGLLHSSDVASEDSARALSQTSGMPFERALARFELLEAASSAAIVDTDDPAPKYVEALDKLAEIGETLTDEEAAEARRVIGSRFARTRAAAGRGYEEGVEKLVSTLVSKGLPVAIVEGLGWLVDSRSWLAVLLRFALGILA